MNVSASTILSNISEIPETSTFSQSFRLVVSLSYVILLILALMISFLQLASYIKGRKVFKTMAFFIISSQMLICNLIIIFVKIIFMTTTAISENPIFPEKVYFVLAFLECISYDGLLFFAFLLTLNRLLVFGFPKTGRFIFEDSRIYISISIFWIVSVALAALIMLTSCPIVADPKSMEFAFHCTDGEPNVYYYIWMNCDEVTSVFQGISDYGWITDMLMVMDHQFDYFFAATDDIIALMFGLPCIKSNWSFFSSSTVETLKFFSLELSASAHQHPSVAKNFDVRDIAAREWNKMKDKANMPKKAGILGRVQIGNKIAEFL